MSNEIQYTLYSIDNEDIKVKVAIKDETIWVTQRGMAELFDVNVSAISKHLANIYAEGELSQPATVSKMEIVHTEGTRQVTRLIDFYNLDAVISVGYRVNSRRATQFRIWATGILKEFIKKGFVLDDKRLKQGKIVFGKAKLSIQRQTTARRQRSQAMMIQSRSLPSSPYLPSLASKITLGSKTSTVCHAPAGI